MLVTLRFEGEIDVEVDADPEDSEALVTAIGLAYERLSDSDIAEAAELTGHEIIEDE